MVVHCTVIGLIKTCFVIDLTFVWRRNTENQICRVQQWVGGMVGGCLQTCQCTSCTTRARRSSRCSRAPSARAPSTTARGGRSRRGRPPYLYHYHYRTINSSSRVISTADLSSGQNRPNVYGKINQAHSLTKKSNRRLLYYFNKERKASKKGLYHGHSPRWTQIGSGLSRS